MLSSSSVALLLKSSLTSLYKKYIIFLVILILSYGYYCYVCLKQQIMLVWHRRRRRRRNKEDDDDESKSIPSYNNHNDDKQTNQQRKRFVVITGCDRGFGRELAEELIKIDTKNEHHRYHVLALTLAQQAADELNKKNSSRLEGRKCDVTDEQDVKHMKDYVEQFLSANKDNMFLYAIVNNAGVVDPGDFVWYKDSISAYQHIMDVNFFGQLRITQALLPIMLLTNNRSSSSHHTNHNEKKRIINMSSVCGTSASPGNSAYNASKFAVEAWSDSLRIELKPFDIRVVKVRPGQIQTEIQKEWVQKFMERYEAANDQVKALYGGDEYRKKANQVFESGSSNIENMTKSHVVVDALKEILQNPSPRPSYWIGDDALVFWRAMSYMHTAVADTVKGSLGISPVMTKEKKD